MRKVLDFLYDLSLHNDRDWFNANKDRYIEANNTFNVFAMQLASRLADVDYQVGRQQLKDMTYRIYRDVRFSKNKMPYKTHFGAFICRGGKKSPYSGYYFQIGVNGEGEFEGGNMLAVGDYWIEPKALRVMREDISMGEGEFGRIVSMADPRFSIDSSDALKRSPVGYPSDCQDAEYLKLRRFCLCYCPDDDFITSPELLDRTVELFSTATPFLHYLNRAIEFSLEEGSGDMSLDF